MNSILRSVAKPLAAAASFTVLLASRSAADPPRFSIKDITPATSAAFFNAAALEINNAGQVAGFHGDTGSFLYDDRDGSLIDIPVDDFLATDINEAGAVVGTADFGELSVVLFADGVVTDVGFIGMFSGSTAGGVNDAGEVTGDGDFAPDDRERHAFLYSGGTVRFLDFSIDQGSCEHSEAHDINDAGQIVGGMRVPTDSGCMFRAFLHQDGETLLIGDLLPDEHTSALKVNEVGQALVSVRRAEQRVFGGGAYLYSDGEMQRVGDDQTTGHGLNNLGWVVGEIESPEENRAFLYVDGEFYDLDDLVPDLTGWDHLFLASDVNDSGQIVGGAIREDGLLGAILLTPLDVKVKMNVRPWSRKNKVNLRSNGDIPVAILSTGTFDATQVDWQTVRFGPGKAKERHEQIHLKDVGKDGDMDAVLHFRIRKTGIRCHDEKVTLTGKTFSGVPFRGTGNINVVKCRR